MTLRPLLLVLGASHLLIGLVMALAPRGFYELVAGSAPYNGHFLRDMATFYLALGVITVVAARRPPWRVPVLAFTLLQYGLHVVNHGVDAGDAEPAWHGPANVVSLALVALAAWWLYRRAQEEAA